MQLINNTGGTAVFSQTMNYDELGRLLHSIGASSQTTTFAYDRTDLLKTVTDPRSNLYAYAYDALQRVIRETDQESAQVNYGLDARDGLASYTDPRSLVTNYVRNGFGEAIQEASPDSGTTVYVRNALGDVTQMTDGRGFVTNYSYDDAGRMLNKTFPSAPAENVVYGWDTITSGNKGKGRLTGVIDQSGSAAWVYDAKGNVVSETRTIGNQAYVTSYAYNAAGQLTQITYPSGRVVTQALSSLGQVSGVTMKKTAAAASENIATGIAYRPFSDLLTVFTYGNGLSFAASYDLDYRLLTLAVKNGAANVISRSYAYSDGLNLTDITDSVTPGNTVDLSYTPANRLSAADGPWGDVVNGYDSTGNRTAEMTTLGGATTTRQFNYPAASNRLASETVNGSTTRSFSYDAAGNLLTGLPLGASYSLSYNRRNRPSQVKLNGSPLANYYYNALEQMATRVTFSPASPTGSFAYIYDIRGQLIAEANGTTGEITREYVWLDGMPLAVVDGVETASPVTSFVHVDHLMRPIRMTNAAKATVWSATWLPWGGVHVTSGATAQNLRFPGQYFLIEQGMHYNWHRIYDPTTGRYTQPDPLGMPDGPARYAYALNSPLNHIDEYGLAAGGGDTGRLAKCRSIKKKISELDKQIDRQYSNLENNPDTLPERVSPTESLSESIRGHRTLINRYWSQRNKLYDEYNNYRCDDDGSGGCPQCGAVAAGAAFVGICALCLAQPEICAIVGLGGALGAAAQ